MWRCVELGSTKTNFLSARFIGELSPRSELTAGLGRDPTIRPWECQTPCRRTPALDVGSATRRSHRIWDFALDRARPPPLACPGQHPNQEGGEPVAKKKAAKKKKK